MAATSKEGTLERYQEHGGQWEYVRLNINENGEARFKTWNYDSRNWVIDTVTAIKDVEATANHAENKQFRLQTDAGTSHLQATNETERNEWVEAISHQIRRHEAPSTPDTTAATTKEGMLERYREQNGCWEYVSLSLSENGKAQIEVWNDDSKKWILDIVTTLKDVEATENHAENKQFRLQTSVSTFYLQASSEKGRNEWVQAITDQISHHKAFYSEENDSFTSDDDPVDTPSCVPTKSRFNYQQSSSNEENQNERDGFNTLPYPVEISTPSLCINALTISNNPQKMPVPEPTAAPEKNFIPTSAPNTPYSRPIGFNFDQDIENRTYQKMPVPEPTAAPEKNFIPTSAPYNPFPRPIGFNFDKDIGKTAYQKMPVPEPTAAPEKKFIFTSAPYNPFPRPIGFNIDQDIGNRTYQQMPVPIPTGASGNSLNPASSPYKSGPPPNGLNYGKDVGHPEPEVFTASQPSKSNSSELPGIAGHSATPNGRSNAQHPSTPNINVCVVNASKTSIGLPKQVTSMGKKLLSQAAPAASQFAGFASRKIKNL